MARSSIRWCALAVAVSVVAVTGCNKAKNEAPPPLAAGEPVAVTPLAAASQSAAPAVTIPEPVNPIPMPIPPPVAPPAAAAPAGGSKPGGSAAAAAAGAPANNFKACCAALHKQADTATGAEQSKLLSGATACDGIAGVVASGKTSPKDAYTSLRAALRGAPLPAGCK